MSASCIDRVIHVRRRPAKELPHVAFRSAKDPSCVAFRSAKDRPSVGFRSAKEWSDTVFAERKATFTRRLWWAAAALGLAVALAPSTAMAQRFGGGYGGGYGRYGGLSTGARYRGGYGYGGYGYRGFGYGGYGGYGNLGYGGFGYGGRGVGISIGFGYPFGYGLYGYRGLGGFGNDALAFSRFNYPGYSYPGLYSAYAPVYDYSRYSLAAPSYSASPSYLSVPGGTYRSGYRYGAPPVGAVADPGSPTSDLRPGMVLPDGSTVISVGPLGGSAAAADDPIGSQRTNARACVNGR